MPFTHNDEIDDDVYRDLVGSTAWVPDPSGDQPTRQTILRDIPITQGEMEAILASMHDIAPHRRTAFAGRLKHFNRLGLMAPSTSRGRTTRYSAAHLMARAFVLELVQLGMTPDLIIEIFSPCWELIKLPIAQYVRRPQPLWAALEVDALNRLSGRESPLVHMAVGGDLRSILPRQRGSIICLSQMVATVVITGAELLRVSRIDLANAVIDTCSDGTEEPLEFAVSDKLRAAMAESLAA